MKSFWMLLAAMSFAFPKAYSQQEMGDAFSMAVACLECTDPVVLKSAPSYCVIGDRDGEGYVVFSLSNGCPQGILGYSRSSRWIEGKMPPALLEYLEESAGNGLRLKAKKLLLAGNSRREDILPLLETHWHQSSPYNDLCPTVEDGNFKTAAGCVAVAAAQVAYYWRKDNPASVQTDTPTYPYGDAPITLSVPAGTPYDWLLIQAEYAGDESLAAKEAVARLVYVVGTSSFLNYGSSTGGKIRDAGNALYSQFHLLSDYAPKEAFTQEAWEDSLLGNLEKGRPIVYSGNSPGGGHAVVIDGYDASYGLFHFNFGWGGSGDGYYTVDNETGMNGYSSNQACVWNIGPKTRNIVAELAFPKNYARGDTVGIAARIVNNSTLPIKVLCLYVSAAGSSPGDLGQLLHADSVEIANDGEEAQIPFLFHYDGEEKDVEAVLADGAGYVLARKPLGVLPAGLGFLRTDDGMKIRRESKNLISITVQKPILVRIYSVGGISYFQEFVEGECKVSLPEGVYVVNGKRVAL